MERQTGRESRQHRAKVERPYQVPFHFVSRIIGHEKLDKRGDHFLVTSVLMHWMQ